MVESLMGVWMIMILVIRMFLVSFNFKRIFKGVGILNLYFFKVKGLISVKDIMEFFFVLFKCKKILLIFCKCILWMVLNFKIGVFILKIIGDCIFFKKV